MSSQRKALMQLLTDEDPETVRLVREQLVSGGQNNIPELQGLLEMDNEQVSVIARDILSQIEHNVADENFYRMCSCFDEYGDLESALWNLTRALIPDFNSEVYENRLQLWARQIKRQLSGAISSRERVMELATYLSSELGFHGNTDNYYCEKNSLIPAVLDTRLGIPITLTIIYMMIGRRAGLQIEGIKLPGHFIARHEDVLFDPFHKGRILTQGDCREILSKQNLPFEPKYLMPATPRQILIRVLANLLYVYDLEDNEESHDQVNRWIKALSRNSPVEN